MNYVLGIKKYHVHYHFHLFHNVIVRWWRWQCLLLRSHFISLHLRTWKQLRAHCRDKTQTISIVFGHIYLYIFIECLWSQVRGSQQLFTRVNFYSTKYESSQISSVPATCEPSSVRTSYGVIICNKLYSTLLSVLLLKTYQRDSASIFYECGSVCLFGHAFMRSTRL